MEIHLGIMWPDFMKQLISISGVPVAIEQYGRRGEMLNAMTRDRDNVAESLGDLLEPIRSRRSSGLLSLERLENGRFEEGEVYFHLGQPTYARTGNVVGQEAFNRLLGWRRFYFNFSTNASPAHLAPTAPVARSLPPQTEALQPASDASSAPQKPATISPANLRVLGSGELELLRSSLRDALDIPGIELLVPHKSSADRNVLSLPLTRPQRSLYLLIDGRRTIADLARTMRKGIQEIERLLSELLEKDLIAF
jgi:hypothetical protein